MNTTPGNLLTAEDKRHVLAAYVHRFTGEYKPKWAREPWKNGKPYPVQFRDDADWLANTLFITRGNGRLDLRYQACFSTPTWPFNPELRQCKPQSTPTSDVGVIGCACGQEVGV